MYSLLNQIAGHQSFNDWFAPDTVARHPLGTILTAVDPYWGAGSFMYLKSNAAVLKGSIVIWDETYQATLAPSTANLGFPFAVATNNAAAGTYFWAQVEGLAVYKTNATVAADAALGIAAAGIAGTNAAGKQMLGVRNRIAATGTATVSVATVTNSGTVVAQKGYDGFFLGMALSGTGIPASTVVAGLDADGRRIYLGSAIGTFDKVATATGQITLTGTYTGYGAGQILNPSLQGAIT